MDQEDSNTIKYYLQKLLGKDFTKRFVASKIENPKISFVMPVLDRCHLIAETINSIFLQTEKNWELIIVNDGSTDDIEDLLKFYAVDERVGYINLKKTIRVANARNLGNYLAKSRYIAVADSDDLYLPLRTELSIRALDTGADIFYGSYYEADISGTPVKFHKAKPINMEKFKKRHYTAGGFILAYRKDKAMKTPYRWNLRFNDDYQLIMDWLGAGYKFDFTTKPLGKTRTQLEGISMQEALND